MYSLSKEIFQLTDIAACIASVDFKLLESRMRKYKHLKYDSTKLYECILQSYLFCGFPATIESLKIFKKYYKDYKNKNSQYNVNEFKHLGIRICKLIYKKNYKKLIENMNSYSPDLKDWMIIEGYGKVLGRKGLSLIERELVNISILSACYFENQLHSHLRGCLNLGASKEAVKNVLINISSVVQEKNIKKAIKLLDGIAVK